MYCAFSVCNSCHSLICILIFLIVTNILHVLTHPSCVGPADYLGGERRAIFEIGSSIATVEYSTVNDGIREGIESFIAELTVPPEMQAMGIVAGTPDRATVNINDKEGIHVSLLVHN